MCLLCAITGMWLTKGDNNIFTQIGFLVLIGLACKNAILIVEFARELHLQGRSAGRSGARGLPHPAPAHPHDVVRLHHGRAAAGVLERRRRRDAARDGRRGVLRACSASPSSASCSRRCSTSRSCTSSNAAGRARRPPSSRPGSRSMRRPPSRPRPDRGPGGCAGAPAYRSSDVPVPPAFREATVDTTRSPAERMPPRPAFDSTAPTALPPTRCAARHPGARPAGGGAPPTSRLLAHARRHDARPPIGEAIQANLDVRAAAGTRAGRARGAHRGRARLRADGHGRRRIHPPAALERDVPDRRRRRVPRPGHLGRRLRRVVGAGPVRPGAAERPGAGRARRRGRARTCATCRCRSPPSWRARTSSCAGPRSGSPWRGATPTTSAARSR